MTVELRTEPVRVRVPATSANLGPGYDCAGVALEMFDELSVAATGNSIDIEVVGQGSDSVPRDESHLVIKSLRAGLAIMGADPPGLRLKCRNTIPHGRGLGSSSAAIVGGLALARQLVPKDQRLSDADLLEVATDIEGHPDNVAPALMGGFTIAWTEDPPSRRTARADAGSRVGRACGLVPDHRVVPVVAVPTAQLATERARDLMPATVPLRDAAFVAGRSALLVEAMTHRPELLLEATADRLHQEYRRFAYPQSYALMLTLREHGIPAAISGAGPSVIALTRDAAEHDHVLTEIAAHADDFVAQRLPISRSGVAAI